MASRDEPPTVVIARGRARTDALALGPYALGGGPGFGGTVEVYEDPERAFDLTSGEPVIT